MCCTKAAWNHFRDARMILFTCYIGDSLPIHTPFRLAPVSLLGNYMNRAVISPEPFVQKCKSLAKAKKPLSECAGWARRISLDG